MLITALANYVARYPDRPLPDELIARVKRAARLLDEGATAACAIGIDYRRRDSALRRCAELLHPDPAAEPWTAAGRVLRVLEAFQRVPREPRTEAEEALQAAIDAGLVALSQKQISRVLAS